MRSVWKFPFSVSDWCEFPMPVGAKILHLAVQHGDPCLWAEVDSDAPTEMRTFRTYGTGHAMGYHNQHYVGTYMVQDGALVFHVYEQVRL